MIAHHLDKRPAIVPTTMPLVTELGYPKLVAENFVGISAPGRHAARGGGEAQRGERRVLADPKVQQRLEEFGFVTRR